MKYQVRFEKRAQKTLKKMDKHQASIIMAWIKKNLVDTTDPRTYGQGLTANRSGEWRYRIGDYRMIAHIDDFPIFVKIHREEFLIVYYHFNIQKSVIFKFSV